MRKFEYFMAIWNSLRPFGTINGPLVILCQFGIVSPVLVFCAKKNLATVPEGLFTRTKKSCRTVSHDAARHTDRIDCNLVARKQ
jgi:hypothetical protein